MIVSARLGAAPDWNVHLVVGVVGVTVTGVEIVLSFQRVPEWSDLADVV